MKPYHMQQKPTNKIDFIIYCTLPVQKLELMRGGIEDMGEIKAC